ncbi:hypothetical protein [Cetobacterium ceti]
MFVQEEILNLQNLIKKEIEFEKKLVSENTNLTIIEKKKLAGESPPLVFLSFEDWEKHTKGKILQITEVLKSIDRGKGLLIALKLHGGVA